MKLNRLDAKELNNILPPELDATFNSLDFEEFGGLTINSFQYFANELHFEFSLFLGDIKRNETQKWRLQVLNYRYSNIRDVNSGGYFSFYADHFLLWEFIDNTTELYFKKHTSQPELLLTDIYSIHNGIFNSHIPLERFINGNDLLKLCKASHGLFARGPKRILEYYFDSLNKRGKEPYYYADPKLTRWDSDKGVPEDREFKLTLLGANYFIGTDFIFTRLS